MDAHSARAEKSSRRAVRTLALGAIVVFACGVAGPATAAATENIDLVFIQSIGLFTNNQQIRFHAVRMTGNPQDPVRLTVTESAEGTSVTITDISRAAGGFAARAPCLKTEAATAVCPTHDEMNRPVSEFFAITDASAENNVTVDTPTLDVLVAVTNGNDTVSVPHSLTSEISGGFGNDTITGGTGFDTFYADGGTDTIFAFNEPAARDLVECGIRGVESPSDIAHVDSLDVLANTNCARVIRGP